MGKLEKTSAWNLTKVRSKKEVIDEARTEGAKVHFASLMDICHLKNAELETKHQKYKGRVVLRGDIVKDDSGSHAAVFTEGSSASQKTAAKVMDIISRLLGCAGQAADAVSAYTQVKMEDAPKLLKIPKSECPDIWIRLPRHIWPKSWSSMEDPVVPLKRNLYGHLLAGLPRERQFVKVLLKHGWEKIPNWECLFVHREKGLYLSVYVDDIKLVGKKQNLDPIWKILMKDVDFGSVCRTKSSSLLCLVSGFPVCGTRVLPGESHGAIHVGLGCAQTRVHLVLGRRFRSSAESLEGLASYLRATCQTKL